MQIREFPDALTLAHAATDDAVGAIEAAIAARGRARVVAATGTSQIAFLADLTTRPGIAWDRVELFHLDEYLGLGADHPASFVRYLLDRLVTPAGIRHVHFLAGDAPTEVVIREVSAAIREAPIDVLFAGIGENAHLAFNDPPADFETSRPFLVVDLDEACRRQQVGEGWFSDFASVPARAITMSVRQILKAERILCLASGARKARAVADSFGPGPVSPAVPASILREHPGATVYLDGPAAAGLDVHARARWSL